MDQSSVLELTEIITSTVRSREIVDQLIKAGQPIGLDAEGIELGPKGKKHDLDVDFLFQKSYLMYGRSIVE